jgi:DNA-directed RNA polymerase subunit RPC12/RpoP
MRMPEEGTGVYLCAKCRTRISFPTEQNGKIVKANSLFPRAKCSECGGTKFIRDPRVQY